MNIVLFEDAISYVCKIHRIIKLGKGNFLKNKILIYFFILIYF